MGEKNFRDFESDYNVFVEKYLTMNGLKWKKNEDEDGIGEKSIFQECEKIINRVNIGSYSKTINEN